MASLIEVIQAALLETEKQIAVLDEKITSKRYLITVYQQEIIEHETDLTELINTKLSIEEEIARQDSVRK